MNLIINTTGNPLIFKSNPNDLVLEADSSETKIYLIPFHKKIEFSKGFSVYMKDQDGNFIQDYKLNVPLPEKKENTFLLVTNEVFEYLKRKNIQRDDVCTAQFVMPMQQIQIEIVHQSLNFLIK